MATSYQKCTCFEIRFVHILRTENSPQLALFELPSDDLKNEKDWSRKHGELLCNTGKSSRSFSRLTGFRCQVNMFLCQREF